MKSSGEENDNVPESNRICAACIGEKYLQRNVKKVGDDATCSYCGQNGKTISIGTLADHVDQAFTDHYELTEREPSGVEYTMYKESDRDWERDGEPAAYVIADAARIDEAPAEDVRQVLADRYFDFDSAAAGEESHFDEDTQYTKKRVQDDELQEDWLRFQKSLKTEARLFNRNAEAILNSIFEGLDKYATPKGKSLIVDAGPGTRMAALFRARVFQSDSKLEEALMRPDIELAPPPPTAGVAGRMNARGIAVFYGATDASVALAETRPPVGSKSLVGRFDIIRPLRLLDVEALRSIYVKGSIFDSSYLQRLEKAKFLESLSHRITQPVMPDDEPFEYLVTQAIADYLATRAKPSLDGIIYPSVQDGKTNRNVVLFHKAARVEAFDIPPGTKITADIYDYDDDGRSPNYTVYERIPPKEDKEEESGFSRMILPFPEPDSDRRDPALRLNVKSLEVRHVQRVTFRTNSFPVERNRSVRAVSDDGSEDF